MPNTPAMVGAGFTALCEETTLSETSFAWAKALFQTLGETAVLPERLFDAVVALTAAAQPMCLSFRGHGGRGRGAGHSTRACLPGGRAGGAGLGQDGAGYGQAHRPAQGHGVLAGGTTIDAVASLERDGFRSAVIDAMLACAEKSRRMAEPRKRSSKEPV
jgi:pyrroline-5-carboxylate reductase